LYAVYLNLKEKRRRAAMNRAFKSVVPRSPANPNRKSNNTGIQR